MLIRPSAWLLLLMMMMEFIGYWTLINRSSSKKKRLNFNSVELCVCVCAGSVCVQIPNVNYMEIISWLDCLGRFSVIFINSSLVPPTILQSSSFRLSISISHLPSEFLSFPICSSLAAQGDINHGLFISLIPYTVYKCMLSCHVYWFLAHCFDVAVVT